MPKRKVTNLSRYLNKVRSEGGPRIFGDDLARVRHNLGLTDVPRCKNCGQDERNHPFDRTGYKCPGAVS